MKWMPDKEVQASGKLKTETVAVGATWQQILFNDPFQANHPIMLQNIKTGL